MKLDKVLDTGIKMVRDKMFPEFTGRIGCVYPDGEDGAGRVVQQSEGCLVKGGNRALPD